MEPTEYKTMFRVEDRHWWYAGMRRITLALLAEAYPTRRDLAILDAGCGTGGAIGYLGRFGTVTGVDLSPLALNFSRRRGLTRLAGSTVARLPFAAGQFDLVTSFDVLYHRAVGDYRLALDEFYRVLKPGGRLLLRLPAYDWLRGHHDAVIHTAHRFTTAELGQALAGSRFEVEKLSYANTLLFPLALGKRLAERLGATVGDPPSARRRSGRDGRSSDVTPNPAWLDRLLTMPLAAEARWLAGHNLPFGLTAVAIGRKPETKEFVDS